MKLQLSVDLKKLIHDMRGPKGASALTEEFERLSKEFNRQVRPQAQAQMKKAEAKYHSLVKKLHTAQKDLDKEVGQKINTVKKQAHAVEKNFAQYKKLAMKQKEKFQKSFSKKSAGGAKPAKAAKSAKASKPAKTSKKASSKKTSKKVSSAAMA